MDSFSTLKPAQIILEAVQLTSEADITLLRQLVTTYPVVLKLDLILRIILTFLPESTEPVIYIDFLRDLSTNQLGNDALYTGSIHSVLPIHKATSRVRRLRLLPLADPTFTHEVPTDPLTLFLQHRARRIDDETGSLLLVSQLVEPFLGQSAHLRTWAISTLLPLLRLDYEYYLHNGLGYSLASLEVTSNKAAIDSLLSEAGKKGGPKSNIGRDLRGLVGPWMYGYNRRKRRKRKYADAEKSSGYLADVPFEEGDDTVNYSAGDWSHLNDWLLNLAVRDYPRAVAAVLQWNGPIDVDYGGWDESGVRTEDANPETSDYAQTCLALVYASSHWSSETLQGSYLVIQKVAKFIDMYTIPELNIEHAGDLGDLDSDYLQRLSQADFLLNSLLRSDNLLTIPSKNSLQFCFLVLLSSATLGNLGYQIGPKRLAELTLFGGEAEQMAELRKISHSLLTKPNDREQWAQARNQMLWLRDWNSIIRDPGGYNPGHGPGVFCRIDVVNLEIEMLKVLLSGSHYDLAREIYGNQALGPIPLPKLEETVVNAALSSFDSASNGNRTRGGVRKASEIIGSFQSYFPKSESIRQLLALLTATHAMSYYSLTLQHGVPFQPVNIRAHQDPLSLIQRILAQNTHSYTKLDDLLEIGENLSLAGLNDSPQNNHLHRNHEKSAELRLAHVKRRVTAMAIEAALAEDDFDTAYSYVVNRLSLVKISNSSMSEHPKDLMTVDDDISWRAAYQAGCHTSVKPGGPSTLRRLEQRMELLSHALLLAPASALSEVLDGWRQCEENLAALSAQETEADEKWDDRGDRRLPGGYSSDSSPVVQKRREPSLGALSEEAPMGLFDVARGAASALRKNAFPLRSARDTATDFPVKSLPESPQTASGGAVENGALTGADSEGRVRKRDMVSNMVTGGLASGIGWVIGAPPTRAE